MKLQFFSHALQFHHKFQSGETSGNKLPPYVMLNRRTVPKEIFCKDIIVWAQKNAWITSELMED
jgi:hypothetical protein